ncbi:MAG: DUF4249 family protein [Fulvivirga sp.]
MKYYSTALFILIALISTSCDDIEDVEVLDARIIVEGFLHAGQPIMIDLSKELLYKGEVEETSIDLEGLKVTISNGSEEYLLIDEGDGIYTNENLVSHSTSYSISFTYNGQEVHSETLVPTKPEGFTSSTTNIEILPFTGGGPPTNLSGESIELNWENNDGAYYLVVVTNIEEDPISINSTTFNRPSFRSEPLVSDNYEIASTDFESYGDHLVILYKLNPEYAALYEDSGDNSLTISTPYTNIENGLGIFTAINSDSLYVNVHD